MDRRIIVIVGASGSGKTTIANLLQEGGIPRLITTTTRPIREGEVDGVDYHFATDEEVATKAFVEMTSYAGYTYGLTIQAVQDGYEKSDTVSVIVDKNGAKAIKRLYPDEAIIVYLSVGEETIIERMTVRGDSEEAIFDRVEHARRTGEFEFKDADIILQDLSPEDNAEWLKALTVGELAYV